MGGKGTREDTVGLIIPLFIPLSLSLSLSRGHSHMLWGWDEALKSPWAAWKSDNQGGECGRGEKKDLGYGVKGFQMCLKDTVAICH